jgi:hypothetical protein
MGQKIQIPLTIKPRNDLKEGSNSYNITNI